MKDTIVKEMLDFLAKATPEQLKEVGEEINKYNSGPLASDYIEREMAVFEDFCRAEDDWDGVTYVMEGKNEEIGFTSSVYCLAA